MAEATTTPAPTTPAATRTIREILGLHDLLVFLGDGHAEIVTGEDGKLQRGKTTPHSLGLRARYAILKSRAAAEKVVKRIQKLRDDRITELSGGTNQLNDENDAKGEKRKQIADEVEKLLETTETIHLHQIPIEDLRLDVNGHITDSIVLSLGDLVSEPVAESKAA